MVVGTFFFIIGLMVNDVKDYSEKWLEIKKELTLSLMYPNLFLE
jgi:hypothetical protein